MAYSRTYPETEPKTRKVALLVVVIALILGLIGGLLGAFFFAKPGAQGIQGIQGPVGPQGIQGLQGPRGYNGSQGIQGEPGLNGTNAIQQMLQTQSVTAASLGAYTATNWYNMSVFDSSMHLTININNQSRICAEFATTVYLSDAEVWFRIVIDNQYLSTTCYTSSSPNMHLPVQIKILTSALSAGQHTIDVQFYRVKGTPTVLDRALTVTEQSSC